MMYIDHLYRFIDKIRAEIENEICVVKNSLSGGVICLKPKVDPKG